MADEDKNVEEKKIDKDKMKAIVLIVVIVLSLAFITKRLIPKKYTYMADVMCDSCDAVYQTKIVSGQRFPIKCKECGIKSAYRAYRCRDCEHIFIIKPVVRKKGEMPTPGMEMEMYKCPKCSSMNIGSVTPPKPKPEKK